MNIFERFGGAFSHFFTSIFHEDAAKAWHVIETNSPIVNAAKPVIADIKALVPDTKVAVETARSLITQVLVKHFTIADAEKWIQDNTGLDVPTLLRAAAQKIVSSLPASKGFSGAAINLGIEFALQLLRV